MTLYVHKYKTKVRSFIRGTVDHRGRDFGRPKARFYPSEIQIVAWKLVSH